MLLQLLDFLTCPICLPKESPLRLADGAHLVEDDVETGSLLCDGCGAEYSIENGLASITPPELTPPAPQAKYDTDTVLGSYLWSSFADLMNEDRACNAYARWADMIPGGNGPVVDAGCAVGRSTFEAAAVCGFAVGFDLSTTFMTAARTLHREGRITCAVTEQGRLLRTFVVELPDRLRSVEAEFIVADAMAMPFRSRSFGCALSLNVVDKLPQPALHIRELDRGLRPTDALLVLADPFSWSEGIAPPEHWLGGVENGPMAGRSEEVVPRLLAGEGGLVQHGFTVQGPEDVAWIIRNHANHREEITSKTFRARR